MSESKVYRKDIEFQVRSTLTKKIVTTGAYYVNDKVSLDTVFNKCSLSESMTILMKEFKKAAAKFAVTIDEIKFHRIRNGSYLTASRLENDEEFEQRIQYETDSRVSQLRYLKNQRASDKQAKQRKIKKLQEELNNLTQS